jgi:hypothetical protein
VGVQVIVGAVARDGGERGWVLYLLVLLMGLVLLGDWVFVDVGFGGVLEVRGVGLGGGIMVSGTASWSRPLVGAWGNGGLSVKKTCNQVVPVFFIQGFMYLVLEGAVVIDGDFRYVGKEKVEVLHNVVLVVEEGTSNLADIVPARCQHLLSRTVVWSTYCLAQEVELTRSNHVSDSGYVIEHFPHMFVV